MLTFLLLQLAQLANATQQLSSIHVDVPPDTFSESCYRGASFLRGSNFYQCCEISVYDYDQQTTSYLNYLLVYSYPDIVFQKAEYFGLVGAFGVIKDIGQYLFIQLYNGVAQVSVEEVNNATFVRTYEHELVVDFTLTNEAIAIATYFESNYLHVHNFTSGSLMFSYAQPEFASGFRTVCYHDATDTLYFSGYDIPELYYFNQFTEIYSQPEFNGSQLIPEFGPHLSLGGFADCKIFNSLLYCVDMYLDSIVKMDLQGNLISASVDQPVFEEQLFYPLTYTFVVGDDTQVIYFGVYYFDINYVFYIGVGSYQESLEDNSVLEFKGVTVSQSSNFPGSMYYMGNGLLLAHHVEELVYYSVINATVQSLSPERFSGNSPLNVSLYFSSPVIPISWIPFITIGAETCADVSWVDQYVLQCQPVSQVGADQALVIDFTGYNNPLQIVDVISYVLPVITSYDSFVFSNQGGQVLNLEVDNLGLPNVDLVTVLIGDAQCLEVNQTSSTSVTCIVPVISTPFDQSLTVAVGGQSSAPVLLAVVPPVIVTNGHLQDFSTAGNQTLEIQGSGFGYCLGAAQCSSIFVNVTYGSFQCNSAQVVNDSLITCQTSPGVGVSYPVNVMLGPQKISLPITANFSYRAPRIIEVQPQFMNAQLGGKINILGQNFGQLSDQLPVLSLILLSDQKHYVLNAIANSIEWSHTMISFTIGLVQQQSLSAQINPGVYAVYLIVGGQSSNMDVEVSVVKQPFAVQDQVINLKQGQQYPTFNLGPSQDQFGSPLRYVVSSLPINGSVFGAGNVPISRPFTVLQSSVIQFVPAVYFTGLDGFSFQVLDVDSNITSRQALFQFNYTLTNQAPFVQSYILNADVQPDAPTVFLLEFTDKDDEQWLISVLSLPTRGILTDVALNVNITTTPYLLFGNYTSSGSLIYTPTVFDGALSDAFQWNVKDPNGLELATVVTQQLSLVYVNRAPQVTTQRATGKQYEDVVVTLTAYDADAVFQTLEFRVLTLPVHGDLYQVGVNGTKTNFVVAAGQAVINRNGLLVWQPKANYFGTDSFVYSVSDGQTTVPDTLYIDIEFALKNDFASVIQVKTTSAADIVFVETQSQLNQLSSQSIQQLSAVQSSALVIVSIAVGIILTAAIAFIRWRQAIVAVRTKIVTELTSTHGDGRLTSTTTQELSVNSTVIEGSVVTATFLGTLMVTSHELSVPLFAEKEYGTDFRQTQLIAQGGCGAVFHCDILNKSKFANIGSTKIVVKHFGQDIDKLPDVHRIAFYQELSMLWLFRDQPQFARLYGFSSKPATILLKLYSLGSLDTYILSSKSSSADHRYNQVQVLHLMNILCQGLNYMHHKQFAHCDMKPANVLLELNYESGLLEPRICDFGISRLVDKSQAQVAAFSLSEIRGASVLYAAPEVMRHYRSKVMPEEPEVWKAGDTYAVGVMIAEMVMRRRAWSSHGLTNQ